MEAYILAELTEWFEERDTKSWPGIMATMAAYKRADPKATLEHFYHHWYWWEKAKIPMLWGTGTLCSLV